MTITEAIAQLEAFRAEHGDFPVMVWDREYLSAQEPTISLDYITGPETAEGFVVHSQQRDGDKPKSPVCLLA